MSSVSMSSLSFLDKLRISSKNLSAEDPVHLSNEPMIKAKIRKNAHILATSFTISIYLVNFKNYYADIVDAAGLLRLFNNNICIPVFHK